MTYGYGLGVPLVCDGDVTWVTMLSWEALRLVCSGGFTKLAPCALFIFSDIMKSKSNPDFLKTDRSCVGRQLRGLRSKVSLGVFPGCAEPTRGCTEGPQGASSHAHPTGSVLGLQAKCPLHSSRTVSSVTAGLPGAVLPSGPRLERLQFTLTPSAQFPPHGPLPPAHPSGRWAEGGVPSLLHLGFTVCVSCFCSSPDSP